VTDSIRNPVEWGADVLRGVALGTGAAGRALGHVPLTMHSPAPTVRRLHYSDLKDALVGGAADFAACRSDVAFLCALYPIAGLVLARVVFGTGLIHMLVPLAAGFALVGPLAAVGLIEMSRRRERGEPVTWATALGVARAPSFPAIVLLGFAMLTIFLLWLGAAALVYRVTLGPTPPISPGAFAHAVFATPQGWAMIALGLAVGFVFALASFTISVVSFALLLDRDAGLDTAVATSFRVVQRNPGPMAAWGLLVTAGLVIGSAPLLLGLIVVFPILGHATWHLYRKAVAPF